MSPPKNDPALWTLEGLAAAIPSGEMGFAVEYGWKLLGSIYVGKRCADGAPLPQLHDEEPEYIELWGTLDLDETKLKEFLRADAARHLKPGTRFQIRQKYPENYGRTKGMAWYSCDGFAKRKKWGEVPKIPRRDPEMGFMLVGEYVTPGV